MCFDTNKQPNYQQAKYVHDHPTLFWWWLCGCLNQLIHSHFLVSDRQAHQDETGKRAHTRTHTQYTNTEDTHRQTHFDDDKIKCPASLCASIYITPKTYFSSRVGRLECDDSEGDMPQREVVATLRAIEDIIYDDRCRKGQRTGHDDEVNKCACVCLEMSFTCSKLNAGRFYQLNADMQTHWPRQ